MRSGRAEAPLATSVSKDVRLVCPVYLGGRPQLKRGLEGMFKVLYSLYGIVHATTSLQPEDELF